MSEALATENVSPPVESAGARWLAREKARLAVDHPRLDRVLHWIWIHPAAVLLPLAAVVLGSLGAVIPDGDAGWFRSAGRGMLGPDFWNVFVHPGLQIGPLYLVAVGLATLAVETLGLPVLFTLAAVQTALVTWLGLVTTRRVARLSGAPMLPAQWAVGLALVLGGLLAESVGNGHPEEIALGLLLTLAACHARRGGTVVVGLLLGAAAGIKLWGLLGIPIVVVGRRLRPMVVRCLVGGTVLLLCYGPFFLWGEVNTFSFTWGSSQGSTLAELAQWLGATDWQMRVVQGAAVALVGAWVAWRRQYSPLTLVACIVATRLLLDPLLMTYYPGPWVLLVLMWTWTDPAVRRTGWRFVASAAVPVLAVLPYLVPSAATKAGWMILMVGVSLVMLRVEARAAIGASAAVPALRSVAGSEVPVSTP